MINAIYAILFIIGLPFLCYGLYNLIIGFWGLRKHTAYNEHKPKHRMCAVIAARNESIVIGNLIETLKAQNYPAELSDIYVLPNNCTDNTEEVALNHGAKVYRVSADVKSKGAALEEFFDYTFENNDHYDAFCVFDADNLVDPNFFTAMNNALCDGEKIAQGYRDAKNPNDSWISGCQSIFYWTLNRFMNLAKQGLGWSAALNGTGFMVSAEVLKDGGFRTYSLTEDIEFTTQSIIKGYRVAWVPEALTYDEHPLTFDTSWKQRKRWSTGTIQCFLRYARPLMNNFKETKRMVSLDMLIYLMAPLFQVLSAMYAIFSLIILSMITINTQTWSSSLSFALGIQAFGILASFVFTAFVVLIEKHKFKDVRTPSFFTFWFFLFSWIPINVLCVFSPITTWEPILHTKSMDLAQMTANK